MHHGLCGTATTWLHGNDAAVSFAVRLDCEGAVHDRRKDETIVAPSGPYVVRSISSAELKFLLKIVARFGHGDKLHKNSMIIGWALADTLCLKLEQTENAIRRLHEQHSAAILYDFQGKHRDPSSKPRYSGLLTDGGELGVFTVKCRWTSWEGQDERRSTGCSLTI